MIANAKALEVTVQRQKVKLTDLRNRSRRNNLFIFGFLELDKEHNAVLKQSFSLFHDSLRIDSCTYEWDADIGERRPVRIGSAGAD